MSSTTSSSSCSSACAARAEFGIVISGLPPVTNERPHLACARASGSRRRARRPGRRRSPTRSRRSRERRSRSSDAVLHAEAREVDDARARRACRRRRSRLPETALMTSWSQNASAPSPAHVDAGRGVERGAVAPRDRRATMRAQRRGRNAGHVGRALGRPRLGQARRLSTAGHEARDARRGRRRPVASSSCRKAR